VAYGDNIDDMKAHEWRYIVHELPGLSAACCLLPAACCLLFAACCLLPAVCCLLSAVCCLLPAACCLLFAVCCCCHHLVKEATMF
jgi:hypothetical protein